MARAVASWFGCGFIPRRLRGADEGAGTVGALAALVPALLLGRVGWAAQLAAAVAIVGLSVWASGHFADEGDPAWVVVDEAAGTFIATIGVSLGPALVGFVVFRVADITKRFPLVRRAETLTGGLGITADDVVAGLWGLGAAWIVQLGVPSF